MTQTDAGVPGGASAQTHQQLSFARRSSGLVRDLSMWDVAWYGIGATGALYGLLYYFPLPQVSLPGISLPLAAILVVLVMAPIFAAYAGIGSAMPRMGGDYLFQSRAIHPAVGFSFALAWQVVVWGVYTTAAGITAGSLALQPLLFNLGMRWDSEGLTDAGTWFGSPDGIFICCLVALALAALTTVLGLRVYRTVQRWVLVPTYLISGLILIVLLARGHGSFLSHFNGWHEQALGESNYSGTVLDEARKAGFEGNDFSLKNTLLGMTLFFVMVYVIWSAQGMLGEVKQASSFTKLFKTFALAGVAGALFFFLAPIVLFNNSVGTDFSTAYATAFNGGAVEAPAGATIPSFAMMMTSSPIVLILLSLGLLVAAYYVTVSTMMNMTRVVSAMGMDRTLPQALAKVSQRFHSPVNATLFWVAIAIIINVVYRAESEFGITLVVAGALTSGGVVALSSAAAALLPYRTPEIYKLSPVSRYRLGGIPLITVAGSIGFLVGAALTVANLLAPELGLTDSKARILLLGTLLVAAIWFFVNRAFLRTRGVDLDLAFKQVPPE